VSRTEILAGMTASKPAVSKPARRAPAKPRSLVHTPRGPALDLSQYAPAYFTFITNKWSRGASSHYLDTYGVGIETWRVLVMLAIEESVTAQRVVQLIGMDKASVSRTFKLMHEKGLIEFRHDVQDGRLRHATFTPAGRALHDRILRFALAREQALLSVLSPEETTVLLDLLQRIHANLNEVETASDAFMARERGELKKTKP
jgi:DNA-binding MarR family transcriptional regulator